MNKTTFSAAFLSSLLLFSTVQPVQAVRGMTQFVAAQAAAKDKTEKPQEGARAWKGKKVAFLGDSISDKRHVGTTRCYWEYLAEWLGLEPFVYAINGNQMNGVLKQAQQLLAERGDDIDAIIIFAGTNDYNAGVPVGDWFTLEERETMVKGGAVEVRPHRIPVLEDTTFKGRMNLVLDFLKTNYPTKQIIMLTPIHRAQATFGNKNVQPEELYANKIGRFVDEYIQAVKEASNVWAVPVIDLNAISGLYPLKDSNVPYFHDGATDRLHPSAAGHERMARALFPQLLLYPPTF
jgi:lysophospholipase L1-like esterase